MNPAMLFLRRCSPNFTPKSPNPSNQKTTPKIAPFNAPFSPPKINISTLKDSKNPARHFQAVPGHQFGIRHNFLCVTIGDNAAFVEQDDSIGKSGCKIHIAGRYYQGLSQGA
jgi:hypothetical protein